MNRRVMLPLVVGVLTLSASQPALAGAGPPLRPQVVVGTPLPAPRPAPKPLPPKAAPTPKPNPTRWSNGVSGQPIAWDAARSVGAARGEMATKAAAGDIDGCGGFGRQSLTGGSLAQTSHDKARPTWVAPAPIPSSTWQQSHIDTNPKSAGHAWLETLITAGIVIGLAYLLVHSLAKKHLSPSAPAKPAAQQRLLLGWDGKGGVMLLGSPRT
jgi:hypothetical protein